MIIGIDAINLNEGGGKTHILNLLSHFEPNEHHINKIVIWGSTELLAQIANYSWLDKKSNRHINGSLLSRYYWIIFKSKFEFSECDILFAPGGLYWGGFKPFVSMSRNMLLFDKVERNRQPFILRLKLNVSRVFQILSLKKAQVVIFISKYARDFIMNELGLVNDKCKIVYHGVSSKFKIKPKDRFTRANNTRLKILYISHIYNYKHPWNVVSAVETLLKKGYDLELNIVGGGEKVAIKKLQKSISLADSENSNIFYHGSQPHESIFNYYESADIFVYASTCENMPNILIEAMSASLPIACSNVLPMPEFLKDAGIYFRALDTSDIAVKLEELILSASLRERIGTLAYQYSNEFDWKKTSKQTFTFIEESLNKFKSQVNN